MKRNQEGFVAIEFVFGLCFLLLPMALLAMSFPTWAERQSMARTAARESARTYALTADAGAAQQVVSDMTANYGFDAGDVSVQTSAYPTAPFPANATVSATVTVKVPALRVGGFDITHQTFDFTSTHEEPLDPYRSRGTP